MCTKGGSASCSLMGLSFIDYRRDRFVSITQCTAITCGGFMGVSLKKIHDRIGAVQIVADVGVPLF